MSFRINGEAKEWFKNIRPEMEYDFDYYYLCLMAALAKKEKSDRDTPQAETSEITQDFPGEYRTRGRVIIALLIKTELEMMGINLTERNELNEHIHKLVNPLSPNGLSNEGERLMNRYANRGFEILKEWFENKPIELEVFLPLYMRKLDLAFEGGQPSGIWNAASSP